MESRKHGTEISRVDQIGDEIAVKLLNDPDYQAILAFMKALDTSDEDVAERELVRKYLERVEEISLHRIWLAFQCKWDDLTARLASPDANPATYLSRLTHGALNDGRLARWFSGKERSFGATVKIATVMKEESLAFPSLGERGKEGLYGAFRFFRESVGRPIPSRIDFEVLVQLNLRAELYGRLNPENTACALTELTCEVKKALAECPAVFELTAGDLSRIRLLNDDWLKMLQILHSHWQPFADNWELSL